MIRWIALLSVVLGACGTSTATAPSPGLAERFEIVAFSLAEHPPNEELWKWSRPIEVRIAGDQSYRNDVASHLATLGELTGLEAEMDAGLANMIIEFSDRDTGYTCSFTIDEYEYGVFSAEIHIWSDLKPDHIRHCILQEMTQFLGLIGDLDGLFSSRSDTVFASYTTIGHLTDADVTLIRILYDKRLFKGMSRDHVMPIVHQIVLGIESEQTAAP